jgi:hypothetical protein
VRDWYGGIFIGPDDREGEKGDADGDMEQEEDDGERAPETPLNDKAEKGKNASEDPEQRGKTGITLSLPASSLVLGIPSRRRLRLPLGLRDRIDPLLEPADIAPLTPAPHVGEIAEERRLKGYGW